MNNPLLSLAMIAGMRFLSGCGGGVESPPPPVTATHFSVTPASMPTAGAPFSFTITALGASNQTATAYAGTVHFTSSDTQAVLPAPSTLTNVTGTFTATLTTPGPQTIM